MPGRRDRWPMVAASASAGTVLLAVVTTAALQGPADEGAGGVPPVLAGPETGPVAAAPAVP
ncbi:MAG TPA: hypothetical protein VGD67_23210, partial [Pseudonocardiaceae bacterium]